MAFSVSPTGKTLGSGVLDVAGIVSQLMAVERKPLDAVSAKINGIDLKISAMAAIKSNLSTLLDAAEGLSNPTSSVATSSAPSVLAASATSSLQPGSYSVFVNRLATERLENFSGFSSSADSLSGRSISLTLPSGEIKNIPEQADLNSLKSYLNNNFSESVTATIYTQDESASVLSLRGVSTGSANTFSLSISGADITKTVVRDAVDSQVTIDGVLFTRGTNNVTDIVDGLSLSLVSKSPPDTSVTLTVGQDSIAFKEKVKLFVSAYNEFIKSYKTDTKIDPATGTRGDLAGDSVVRLIKDKLANLLSAPLKDIDGTDISGGMSALGVSYSADNDGTLIFSDALFSRLSAGVPKLTYGVTIGYVSDKENLRSSLEDMIGVGGIIDSWQLNSLADKSSLARRQVDLQDKLNRTQQRYTSEYAALDALLFQLSSVNDSLTSALKGLESMNKSGN